MIVNQEIFTLQNHLFLNYTNRQFYHLSAKNDHFLPKSDQLLIFKSIIRISLENLLILVNFFIN